MLHFSAFNVVRFFSTAQLSMQGGLLLRALRSTPRLSPDDSSGDDQASTTLEEEGGGPSLASGPSAAPPRSLQAPPSSLLNALRALPGNNRVQKSLNLFTGPEYRSRRHMVYLAQCKKLKRLGQIDGAADRAKDEAWNAGVLRFGDQIREPQSSKAHPNQFRPEAVLGHVWQSINRDTHLREGADGCSRSLSMLASVAGAAWNSQLSFVSDSFAAIRRAGHCPFIQRNYDASSNRIGFGRLQPLIAPHARYAIRPDKDGPWHVVGYEDFRKHFGAQPRRGILELFAQRSAVSWMTDSNVFEGIKIFHRPQFLERTNASTTYRAVEYSVPELSPEGLDEVCADVHHCFVNESPDGYHWTWGRNVNAETDTPDRTLDMGAGRGRGNGHIGQDAEHGGGR